MGIINTHNLGGLEKKAKEKLEIKLKELCPFKGWIQRKDRVKEALNGVDNSNEQYQKHMPKWFNFYHHITSSLVSSHRIKKYN